MVYPYSSCILTPVVCNNGKWEKKSIKYNSYHELAYLHPNHFSPDKQIVEKYFSVEKPYFIIRFAKLNAHHDNGIQGINAEIAQRIIDILKPYGDIYITSERELEPQFEQYRMMINLFKGEMKLVGVRPLSPHYFSLYKKELQRMRIHYKPGLLPPFYADMPRTFDEIEQSELRYLRRCNTEGVFATDMRDSCDVFSSS